ncbi:MAG TPA: CAP domain-containing protein, partial [Usitatibacter sp.]|nr:CAP domain-containing protein [Usitatibacter sp.]
MTAVAAHAQAIHHADIAQAVQAVVSRTNALRREAKLPEVHVEPRLTRAADEFARYMARTGRYGHEADGREPPQRAEAHGYDYCIVLENIAYHYDSRGFETGRLARDIVEGWKGSPPHRRNMVNADVTQVGVAIARSDATGYYYTVQMLGLPRSAAVRFEVRNESQRDVRYRVGDQAYTAPARSIRTHEVCGRERLRFERPPAAFEPKGGDRFVVPAQGGEATLRR